MTDTTKAAQMLDDLSNNRLPPPPSSVPKDGRSPFSLPPSLTQSKQAQAPGAAAAGTLTTGSGSNNNPKTKWVTVVKDKCSKVLKTQGIAAAVVFVIVAGVMAAVNPPIVQTKSANPDEKPKRSVVKILVWAAVAAALAMVIPLGIEYAKKKKSGGGSTTTIVAGTTSNAAAAAAPSSLSLKP